MPVPSGKGVSVGQVLWLSFRHFAIVWDCGILLKLRGPGGCLALELLGCVHCVSSGVVYRSITLLCLQAIFWNSGKYDLICVCPFQIQ